jgi:fibronectin type III domain protein
MAASLSAADAPQPPTPHSLIHRQNQQPAAAERGPTTTIPGTTGSRSTNVPPPRKLTKRPSQTTIVTPSTLPATSSAAVSPPRAVAAASISKAVPESRASNSATGLAAVGSSLLNTSPLTSGGANSGPPTAAPSSTAKAPIGSALAGNGAPSSTPAGVPATGRGLQRLTAQLPGLTQLIAPTVTVSSPPPSPVPSSGPQPSPSPSPSPTPSPSPSPSPPPSAAPPTSSPPPPPTTGNAILTWTLNSDPNVTGYKIYVGTASGLYTYPGSPFVIGLTGSYTIAGLPSGQTYYFAISAFNALGGESALSSEVSKSIY